MKVERLTEEFPWTAPDRSEGMLHVSTIIKDIMDTLFPTLTGPVDDTTRLHWEKGLLWEKVLTLAFGDKSAIRIGEVSADGIVLSPDGIAWRDVPNADDEMVVEEYKCTLRSSNKPPNENESWMMQVKAYCKVMGTTVCVFRILYLRGNYADKMIDYGVYRLEFTQTELDENWQVLVRHAKAKGWL